MDGSLAQPLKIGAAAPRVDGRLKVTGAARYASDMPLADPAYAFFATSAIARGRITAIDDREARRVPGVIDILTHQNTGDAIKQTKLFSDGGYVGSTIMPLGSERVWHGGQIVAVALAETFEAAREAATGSRSATRPSRPRRASTALAPRRSRRRTPHPISRTRRSAMPRRRSLRRR
jgi:xanthine dehydrogenase YagR molybdenum-binding subunit